MECLHKTIKKIGKRRLRWINSSTQQHRPSHNMEMGGVTDPMENGWNFKILLVFIFFKEFFPSSTCETDQAGTEQQK